MINVIWLIIEHVHPPLKCTFINKKLLAKLLCMFACLGQHRNFGIYNDARVTWQNPAYNMWQIDEGLSVYKIYVCYI